MKKHIKKVLLDRVGMIILFTIAFVAIGFYVYYSRINPISYSIPSFSLIYNMDANPLNGEYVIGGEKFLLVNGKTEKDMADGTHSTVEIFSSPTYGDINNDGVADVVFIAICKSNDVIAHYIIAATRQVYGYKNFDAIFLDNDIYQKELTIENMIITEKYFKNAGDSENNINENIVYLKVVENNLVQIIK